MGLGHQGQSKAWFVKHTEVVARCRDNPTGRVAVGVVCGCKHVLGAYSSASPCIFVLRIPMRGSIFLWLLVTRVVLQFSSKDTSSGLMFPLLHGSAERNPCHAVQVPHS